MAVVEPRVGEGEGRCEMRTDPYGLDQNFSCEFDLSKPEDSLNIWPERPTRLSK